MSLTTAPKNEAQRYKANKVGTGSICGELQKSDERSQTSK